MTRKEEREQAAHKYINCNMVAPECMQLAYGDFIEGAMWADATAWKPSDEQMEALKTSFLYWNGTTKEVSCTERLESLYEQLKKF